MTFSLNSTRARTARSLALLLICVLGISALLLFLDSSVNPKTGIFKLQTAQFQLASSADAELKPEAWTDVRLPDNWSKQRKEAEGLGWYSIRFDAPANTTALGLHVRRLSMAGEFYLNGHLLAPSMTLTEPIQRMWNTPQYRALPPDWLLAGSNEIRVRLFAYRDYNGGLGVVEIGPDAEIYKTYTKTLFMHSTFAAAAILLLGLIALLALTIGMRFDKGDASPLFLGLSCLTWSIRLVNDYLQVIPLSFVTWGWITHSLGGWVPLFILMYCHRYLQIKRPKLERFMIGYTLVCTLLIGVYLRGGISKDMMAAIWLPFNFATDAYLLYILWKLLRGATRAAPVVLATALAFFVISDVHDRFIVTAVFGNLVGFDSAYWRSLAAVLLSFSFVLLVADQLINAIDDAKKSRVAREQAKSIERSRMTREIHDGIGAQLMTALRGVERGALSQDQISESLQDGLDELRLLMDSADIGSDLHGALFAWRNRWEPRLQAVDLALDWHIEDTVEQIKLPQETVLQIVRILQESVANVVKHAHASKIDVTVIVQSQELVMRISDNGVGLSAKQASSASRGIRNMKQRAEQIGARYSIRALETPAQGTLVEMQLALA